MKEIRKELLVLLDTLDQLVYACRALDHEEDSFEIPLQMWNQGPSAPACACSKQEHAW